MNIGYAAAGLAFLYSRRKLCLGLLRYPAGEQSVSWRNEIWPFQWKIAVSWICSYFSIQIFTPVLFAYRGPAEAGRLHKGIDLVEIGRNLAGLKGGGLIAWSAVRSFNGIAIAAVIAGGVASFILQEFVVEKSARI